MKSKQSLFEEIIALSVRKVRDRSVAGDKDQFQQRMKTMPTKIKQLDADPYMFIFDALIAFPEQVDFVLTQYQNMMNQNFLNPGRNSKMLVQHFRKNLNNHSFRIIQILMDIKEPNLQFMTLFFQIHNTIAMPQNVLEGFRYTGYKWLARTFAFKQYDKPAYLEGLTSGILKSQDRNLPTIQDVERSRSKYILKMLNHMTLTIENNLKPETQQSQSKYGFCFMCLNPAGFYCKDTKVPICSSNCKMAHINYITNNPFIDFQYTQSFKQQVQKLLFYNLTSKKNVPLSIDYLCAIYMNSSYEPKQPLPHKQLLNSSVIVQRIWVLYTMYYQRRNQVFQHIYADCLKNKVDYICINSAKYFLKIAESPRICQMYEFLDCFGFRRVFPIILNNLHDDQYKLKFIYSLVDRVYELQSNQNIGKISNKLEQQSTRQSSLLRAINHQKNPLKNFKDIYGQQDSIKQMVRFIIKNEQQVNKAKICDVILVNDDICRTFLQELFVEKVQQICEKQEKEPIQLQNKSSSFIKRTVKFSPYIDEILRELFYFINIKISDKIYHLFQILLCDVLDIKKLVPSKQKAWNPVQLQVVFSQQNTSSADTMFQFAYLIIMIITEIHQSTGLSNSGTLSSSGSLEKKKMTETQFISRVKSFDAKFASSMKEYIAGVYNRLIDQPFSQLTRGVLCRYPTVKKQTSNNVHYHPIKILSDNWEQIYECMISAKNQTSTLYRICSCLVKFPTLCQPFFQLLLNKLVDEGQQSQNLSVSPSNIEKEQHLLPCINSIMQEEPNCIGVSSWKYLFLRDPAPASPTHIYLFQLSILIHYSKSLTTTNFIWFIRQFCRNVKLSESYQQCLKLLTYNFSLSQNSGNQSQQKQRIQIINKQFAQQLFVNDRNLYYQIQFIKGVFSIENFELGINLLDIVQVNIVSQSLIVFALIDIVESKWESFQKYVHKSQKRRQKKQIQAVRQQKQVQQQKKQQQKQTKPSQNAQTGKHKQPNKIWTHILNKILVIGIHSPHLLQQFSSLLRSIPQLNYYFQILNIEHAISSAFEGRYCKLDQTLTKQLQKFQQHIPQMNSTRCSIQQRGAGNSEQGIDLLQQFINIHNVQCIIKHFKYFWEIETVYTLLSQVVHNKIVSKLANNSNNNNNSDSSDSNKIKIEQHSYQPSHDNYMDILLVLQQNSCVNIIKLQNRLQTVVSYLASVIIQLSLTPAITKHKHDQSDKLLQLYKQQLVLILTQIAIPKLAMQTSTKQKQQKMVEKQDVQVSVQAGQSQVQAGVKQYQQFVSVNNILYCYINTIFTILSHIDKLIPNHNTNTNSNMNRQVHAIITKQYELQQIGKLIHAFNSDTRHRNTIFQAYHKYNAAIQSTNTNADNSIEKCRLPPGLLQHQYMVNLINILYLNTEQNKQEGKYMYVNWQVLAQYLQHNMPIFVRLCQLLKYKQQQAKHSKNKPKLNNNNNNKRIYTDKQKQTQTTTTTTTTNRVQAPSSQNANNSGSNSTNNLGSTNSINNAMGSNQQIELLDIKYQFQLVNQRIQYVKKLLQYLVEYITTINTNTKDSQGGTKDSMKQHKQTDSNKNRIIKQLNNVLVQYLQNGFDFYNSYTHKMEFSANSPDTKYIYAIYQLLNQDDRAL